MPKRQPNELRKVTITPHYVIHPLGSAMIQFGDTHVLCTASVEDRVAPWLQGKGQGWVTAEYDMLPGSTSSRKPRDSHRGKLNGRTQEISRLIGRALRSVVDMKGFGERTVTLDCDVIQADGGTRTAAITGGYVALCIAMNRLIEKEQAKKGVISKGVSAISTGIIEGEFHLDLDYALDVRADVDMNVVMMSDETLVEVQGTAEGRAFARNDLNRLLDLAFGALPTLTQVQQSAIDMPWNEEHRSVSN